MKKYLIRADAFISVLSVGMCGNFVSTAYADETKKHGKQRD